MSEKNKEEEQRDLYWLLSSLEAEQKELNKKTEELRESNKKIKNLSIQIMLTLANAIDAKDTYTKGHSVRVAKYSREIARRMGKSEQEMEEIYYIGLLHDIGKIGIPDEIIRKSEELSNQEYDIIKSHPEIGAEILKDMTEIPSASIGAHWHHERYDGTGYPDQLKEQEIPELARIIGIADAYDAMTSKRSYRDVLPQEVARKEIEDGRGVQFDPAIADIMLAMIDEDTDYQMREV
jgi:putative two-component system response regulator